MVTLSNKLFISEEWLDVRFVDSPQTRDTSALEHLFHWQKPLRPNVKCNVNASVQQGLQSMGFGMVLRNANGEFMVCRTNYYVGSLQVKEAEALALREAIGWAIKLNYEEIIFERDSKTVVDAIVSPKPNFPKFGVVISSCRVLPVNKVANTFEQMACYHACPMIWHHPPTFISDVLNSDCIASTFDE